jgi:hypothetical protein
VVLIHTSCPRCEAHGAAWQYWLGIKGLSIASKHTFATALGCDAQEKEINLERGTKDLSRMGLSHFDLFIWAGGLSLFLAR